MSSIKINFFENTQYEGFSLLKSKGESPCGDNSYIGHTNNFDYIINCDGVSSTSSPDKSSGLLIDKLNNFLLTTKSKKPRIGKITEILSKTNKEYLKKDLATTLDLFVFSKKFNFYVGLGDSSFYILEENSEIIFQNWIHNQSKIIEDHFGKNLGAEHILVNCIGIQHPRFEISENIKIPKNAAIILHSDGIEQFFDSHRKIHSFCKKVIESKSLDENYFNDNHDDLSLIYYIIK